MADPEVWQALLNTGNPYWQQEQQQKGLMGGLLLQEKQRAMQDEQRLRDLYAKGGQVDLNQVMAINPKLGIDLQKAQNENLLQQMNMFKTQGDIEETKRKTQEAKQHTFANTLGPLIENWQDSLGNRQPTAEDLESFKGRLGGALKFLDETYNYKPDVPIDPYHPEQLLGTAESLGYQSRRAKSVGARQEAYESGVGRAQAPVPAGVEMTPQGPMQKPGLPSGMTGNANAFQPATAEDLPMLQQEYATTTDVNRKQILGAMINELNQKSQFITPQQASEMRADERSQETKAVETAKSDVQRTEEGKRITESFKRAMGEGGVSRVMKMISESTSGKGEEVLAKAKGAIPGVGATPGMENIGALNTIAGELRKTIERSPGAQSDKDVALAALDAAAIADPSIPYNQRMKGFLEFTRIIKERAKDLGIDPKQLGIDVDTSTGSSMPTAKTDAEAEDLVKKLKPGQSFIGPDGKTHTIKGL